VNAIVAIARADLLERTRTFGILIVVAALLELGYLYVPDRSAAYSTVDLAGWRGIYDSSWMGTVNAILTITFLPLFGFFLIRPAQSRDAALGTYDIVASSPLPRALVALGKWSSNVALLVAFAALLGVAAIAMQLVRGEDRSIDLLAYLLPFAIVTVPACTVTASLAMAITAIPGLRGIVGGIVWFFVWTALLAIPLQIAGNGVAALDPLGTTVLTASLFHGLATAEPHVNIGNNLEIGFSDPSKHVFRFVGTRGAKRRSLCAHFGVSLRLPSRVPCRRSHSCVRTRVRAVVSPRSPRDSSRSSRSRPFSAPNSARHLVKPDRSGLPAWSA
jgi:ABC-type transport system involved in multi-copper enzyme maturation permease subunit